jgi:hypothetical protein
MHASCSVLGEHFWRRIHGKRAARSYESSNRAQQKLRQVMPQLCTDMIGTELSHFMAHFQRFYPLILHVSIKHSTPHVFPLVSSIIDTQDYIKHHSRF